LDLSENKNIKVDEEYILTVRLAGGREMNLRILYKGENEK